MIELLNLTKMYGKTTIIQNANYAFPDKGLVCLLGESGCGKTTLINLIAGLDGDYSGQIVVDHVNLNVLSENDLCNYRKDYIGFVFQDYQLLSGYSVAENIVYPCVLTSHDATNDIQQTNELLEKIGLSDKVNENVLNLSGGQKQRVAIARALIKNPKVILADEPTGALDRKTSTEIMQMLKEISKTKLVIVITHDHHICDYADEIITIENKKIQIQKSSTETSKQTKSTMILTPPLDFHPFTLAYKNFRTTFLKYFLISCIFSIGILCVIFSLSSGNILDTSISNFKEKNIAFNNGYIKNEGNTDVYQTLKRDDRIINVYKQFQIENVSLSMNDRNETMSEKFPMPKTKETMSYGSMPRMGKNEIVLTPSLAKKFNPQIHKLIGKTMTLKYNHQNYELTISGIYNAGYDDFFVSSDVEQSFYQGIKTKDYYSISYDVKNFEDIVSFSDELSNAKISSENAAEQVSTMMRTFSKIQTLFFIISGMIICVAMFIIIIILIKMQAIRYKMVGLLYSFGFQKNMVVKIIIAENILLTTLVGVISSILLIAIQFSTQISPIQIHLSIGEFIITLLSSCSFILLLYAIINKKLINTPPTLALKK
ncbi:ABC transporter ATP-binding protein/permease [Amedibacillus sp. YH-ame6]